MGWAFICLECSIFFRWLGLLNVYREPSRSQRSFCCWVFLSFLSAWLWKINDINPRIAVAFTSSWIKTTFIKPQHVWMCYSCSRGWNPILWDGPYFSPFSQECFAWSSRGSAGQCLMSRPWRCSEGCRCTSQDKTPHKSTNYLTSYLAVYFSLFSQAFLNCLPIRLLISLSHQVLGRYFSFFCFILWTVVSIVDKKMKESVF